MQPIGGKIYGLTSWVYALFVKTSKIITASCNIFQKQLSKGQNDTNSEH